MLKRALCAMVFAISLALITGAMTTGREPGKTKEKDKEKKFEPKYANTTYVPTADEVINKMFEMAKVNKDDGVQPGVPPDFGGKLKVSSPTPRAGWQKGVVHIRITMESGRFC